MHSKDLGAPTSIMRRRVPAAISHRVKTEVGHVWLTPGIGHTSASKLSGCTVAVHDGRVTTHRVFNTSGIKSRRVVKLSWLEAYAAARAYADLICDRTGYPLFDELAEQVPCSNIDAT